MPRCPPASARAGPGLRTPQEVWAHGNRLGRRGSARHRRDFRLAAPDALATGSLGAQCVPSTAPGRGALALSLDAEAHTAGPWLLARGWALTAGRRPPRYLLSACGTAGPAPAGPGRCREQAWARGARASRELGPPLSTLPRGSRGAAGCGRICTQGTSGRGGAGEQTAWAALNLTCGAAGQPRRPESCQARGREGTKFRHAWGAGLARPRAA